MKKNKFNIAALFLLFVFLAGSVGVNVNRTYCNHCHIYRWQVFFVSFDDDGTDLQLCSCCHTCESRQASPCENAEDDYGYYKIKSVYSTSNHYPHFGDLTALPVFVPSRLTKNPRTSRSRSTENTRLSRVRNCQPKRPVLYASMPRCHAGPPFFSA